MNKLNINPQLNKWFEIEFSFVKIFFIFIFVAETFCKQSGISNLVPRALFQKRPGDEVAVLEKYIERAAKRRKCPVTLDNAKLTTKNV